MSDEQQKASLLHRGVCKDIIVPKVGVQQLETLDLLSREEQLTVFSRMCMLAQNAEACNQKMDEYHAQIQQLEADKAEYTKPGKVKHAVVFVLEYLATACIPAAATLAVAYALNKTEHLVYILIAVVAVWLDVFHLLYQKTVQEKEKRKRRAAKKRNRELELRQQSLQELIDQTRAVQISYLQELKTLFDKYDLEKSLRSYAAVLHIYRTMKNYPSAPLYQIIRDCKEDAYRAHRERLNAQSAEENG